MRVIYGRVSTIEQNEERQLEKGITSFIDKCSGAIPFMDRPNAKQLIEYLKNNPDCQVEINSVDRIGRSTLDILKTIEFFKEKKYKLKIQNLGLDNSSPFFEMMISVLGSLAQHEKLIIRERCIGGIAVAKAKGIYTGRKKGTTNTRSQMLLKHNDIVKCLEANMSISDISKITKKTRNTIYKIKKMV